MRGQSAEDRILVRDALDGKPAARERLNARVAGPVWNACRLLAGEESEARDAFRHAIAGIQANGFGRLRLYDGSSRIETFAGLIARDLLADRLLQRFNDNADEGWSAFEQFFQADLTRIVARRLPGPDREDQRRDAYQEVCLALIADGYHRLRAYGGTGSFAGFVLHTVDHLLIDHIRRTSPRRRLPAAISRMGQLEQAVFRAVHWLGGTDRGPDLAASVARDVNPPPTAREAEAALERVRLVLPAGGGMGTAIDVPLPDELPSEAPTPEEVVLAAESERVLGSAVAALRNAATSLTDDERLYLRIALSGTDPPPAREVAKLMQRPVEEIYQIKRQVLSRLRRKIENVPDVKTWRASV